MGHCVHGEALETPGADPGAHGVHAPAASSAEPAGHKHCDAPAELVAPGPHSVHRDMPLAGA